MRRPPKVANTCPAAREQRLEPRLVERNATTVVEIDCGLHVAVFEIVLAQANDGRLDEDILLEALASDEVARDVYEVIDDAMGMRILL